MFHKSSIAPHNCGAWLYRLVPFIIQSVLDLSDIDFTVVLSFLCRNWSSCSLESIPRPRPPILLTYPDSLAPVMSLMMTSLTGYRGMPCTMCLYRVTGCATSTTLFVSQAMQYYMAHASFFSSL